MAEALCVVEDDADDRTDCFLYQLGRADFLREAHTHADKHQEEAVHPLSLREIHELQRFSKPFARLRMLEPVNRLEAIPRRHERSRPASRNGNIFKRN